MPAVAQDAGAARLKDLVVLKGATPIQVVGYGLVVGLDRTGDRARGQRGSPYTVQSITNMLRHFGITVDPQMLASRNAAAVMVTATIDPYAGPGSTSDVTVSALGDARSLSGGVLLQTPLLNPATNTLHAMAQGPVATGAVLASSQGSSVQVNHTNTGRVPNGALVVSEPNLDLNANSTIGLVLKRPDFTNAVRIAESINAKYPNSASVEHAGLVKVDVPATGSNGTAGFLAAIEPLTVTVDIPARVIINERTGTIVAGGNVRISEVMVTYGSLIVSTQTDPVISQPAPLSRGGQTVVSAVGSASIKEEGTRSVVLPPNTDVNQLAAALNDLGLTSRDVIAIFQAIDRAGALQGELIIL
ncbi:MAG TPA: flagellar basal body P-ring protein FlgI [Rhodothermales bacterium]|nr:flagellar basal body P-ring protein FlgI [Rhodothermales bacterium]